MKTLLLSAVLFNSFAISVFAGSFTVTVPTGIMALANPLNNSNNNAYFVLTVASGYLDGSLVSIPDCSGNYKDFNLDSTIDCPGCYRDLRNLVDH